MLQMASQTGKSQIDSVLGETLSTPITFSYTYDSFDDVASAKSAGEWPNDVEILKVVNATKQRNAMSAARATATATKVAEIKDSTPYKQSEAIKSLVALGMTQEAARGIVESQT
jgi:hypothetical protein